MTEPIKSLLAVLALIRKELQSVFYCTFLLFSSLICAAQTFPAADSVAFSPSIQMIGKYYGDSVVLRWAPAKADLWQQFNLAGYILERYEISETISTKPIREKLNASPIMPWSLDEWKTKMHPEDSMAAIAAQLLFGRSNAPKASDAKTKKTTGTQIDLNEAISQKYDMENRWSLALFLADNYPSIANGLGLRFVDKNIQKGKTYVYSLHAVAGMDSSAILVDTRNPLPLPEMPEIFYEEMDKAVKFRWQRKIADHYFTSYYYERSDDGGKTYRRRNAKPFLQPKTSEELAEDEEIVLIDSLPENYKKYYYRISGVTPFGDTGKPSPAMEVSGRDKTPPLAPEQISAENTGNNKVLIRWSKPTKENDLAGFVVGRGETSEGPFTPVNARLLDINASEFLDEKANSWTTNYYVVSAVDTAGNAGISIPAYAILTDTIPPAKPTGLQGSIDSTGIVSIKWTLGREPDLMGYLVYFANAREHTFSPVSRSFVADSTFTDSISLNSLTENIYYKIAAFDKNRNPSVYSDILELKKPDKIPPVSPVFTRFLVSDTAVTLSWVPSSSIDVVRQDLYRRENQSEWIKIDQFEKEDNSYVDTRVKTLTWYEYALVAVDDSGLQSDMSFPINVRVYDSGIRKNIETFAARVHENSVELSWNYPSSDDYFFLVYRSFNGDGLEMYQQVSANKKSFVDEHLPKGIFEYSVKAVYRDGGQSPLTKPIKIEIN